MADMNMFTNGNGVNGTNGNDAANQNGPGPVRIPDYGLTTPIAPEGGAPVVTGGMGNDTSNGNENTNPNAGLTTPIAPEGGAPVVTGGTGSTGNTFPFPLFPGTPSFPIYPNIPSVPSTPSASYGRVRFLNATTNSFPVSISIDNNTYAINSRFGTITNYDWISDGFHTISVRRSTGMRTLLLQQTVPFTAGKKTTIVLVDSSSGGIELVVVSDTGCSNIPYNTGCYRLANMSYSGSSYDLMLYGGATIFRNVRFQNVTSYKQAVSGTYQFYVTNTSNYSVVNELPIIVIGSWNTSGNVMDPLVSFEVSIESGKNYTSYIIGNNWSDFSFRVLTVED